MPISEPLSRTGLSAAEIARRCEISLQRAEQLLADAEPSMRELRVLSTGLNVPIGFFSSSNDAVVERLRMQFRESAGSRDGLDQTVRKVASFVSAALKILPIREAKPDFLQTDLSEASVANIRNRLGYEDQSEPLLELPARLDAESGVIVSLINQSRFEGISLFEGNYLFVFISPRFPPRMLFTLAHEVGHAVAGDLESGAPIFDLPSEIGNLNKSKKRERIADAFAGQLLLPDIAIARFFYQLRRQLGISDDEQVGDIEIIYLARFYGLSFDAAAMRCEQANLLPKGGAYSLSQHIKKIHGSAEKRADQLGIPPRPQINWPRIGKELFAPISHAISQGELSAGWAAEKFDISLSQLKDLRRSN